MCSLDLESWTLWNERVRTARKLHRCSGCGTDIQPGQQYLDHSNLFEGSWSRESACAPCAITRNAFADAHGQTTAPSTLAGMLRECIGGHEEGEWRIPLAGILRRYRVSSVGRRRLADKAAYRRETRARHTAWRALLSLTTSFPTQEQA